MNKKTIFILLVLTPLFFLITHAIAYLFHEYCHSLMAWAIGYKSNPFALDYGDISYSNIFLLSHVSENVDYDTIEAARPWLGALVAFAGPGIGNVVLFIVSVMILRTKTTLKYVWRYFFLWLTVMNLGNFIDYVPIRTFAIHGDIHEIVSTLKISPWWIMIVFGYTVFYSVWYFYRKILPDNFLMLELNYPSKIIIHLFITMTLFGFFGASGLIGYGDFACFMSLLSIYAVPLVAAAFWPDRRTAEYWLSDR